MRIHWPLLIMVSLFLSPAICAGYLLLCNHKINFNSSQYGTLIQNPPNIGLASQDNKWHLVYVSAETCNQICEKQKINLKKVQTALGADSNRVTIQTLTKEQLPPGINQDSILIVNPRGLYIMNYQPNSDYMGLLKDLKRLLKYSHAQQTK